MKNTESNQILVSGIKLLGIYFLCSGLFLIPQFFLYFQFPNIQAGSAPSNKIFFFIYISLMVLLFVLSGLFMIKKTAVLLRIMGSQEIDQKSENLNEFQVIKIGIILIGIFFFIKSFPTLIRKIYESFIISKGAPFILDAILTSTLQLGLSVLFILYSVRIVEYIKKKTKK